MNEIYSRQHYTLVEGHVYLAVGKGPVTAEALQQLDREFMELFDASPYPLVHLIFDARGVISIPPLNDIRKLKYPVHPRMGYNISLGAFQQPLMRFIVGIATAIAGARSQDFTTLTEACAYLAQKDPSLPPVETWNFPSKVDFAAS